MVENVESDFVCPICLKLFSEANCLVEHLARSRTRTQGRVEKEVCPVCRAPVSHVTASHNTESSSIRVKYGRQEYRLCVPLSGGIRAYLSEVFGIPLGRLSLIVKGRLLQSEAEAAVAIKEGSLISLIGTREHEQMPTPSWPHRLWLAVQTRGKWLFDCLPLSCGSLSQSIRTTLQEMRQVLPVFLASINPSWKGLRGHGRQD
ncbi:hypothetical protein CYMTET_54855 [Cymbomonas tetramitiformis]|uniref:C2H2-type domain-containing protein n=1 Tax=Cymbomonas tetramitiformis TaxID=36881 RepID=A0AAE0BF96_9CHLO|nr:hypothetical protein CYMTET_54855 [Cymbomonas tetramitiformis]